MEDTQSPAARAGRVALDWLPAVAWAGLIFFLSAQPGLRVSPDPAVDLVVRKLGHAAVFGILAVLLWRAIEGTVEWRRPWAWALALAIAYAASDELHQAFVASRHPSPVDVAIDALGAVAAVAALASLRSLRSRAGGMGGLGGSPGET